MFCIDLLTFGSSGSASTTSSPPSPSFHIFSQLVKLLQESNSRTPLLAPEGEVEVEEEMGEVKIDIPTQVKLPQE